MDGFDRLGLCSPDSLPQDPRALDSKSTVIIRTGVGIHLLIFSGFVVVVGGHISAGYTVAFWGMQTLEEVVRK